MSDTSDIIDPEIEAALDGKHPSERDPRNNPEDAYQAFMSMGFDQFRDLTFSLLRGGCLTAVEQVGFDRAVVLRRHPDNHPSPEVIALSRAIFAVNEAQRLLEEAEAAQLTAGVALAKSFGGPPATDSEADDFDFDGIAKAQADAQRIARARRTLTEGPS